MRRGMFVFCVCGDKHAARVDVAMRFLKHFSKADIAVVLARSNYPLRHDQIIEAKVPESLSDHQASIYLKTMLPLLVGNGGVACYIDSDQIATSERVDDIFDSYRPPIMFGPDPSTIDQFSRYAVNCRCISGSCHHLRQSIRLLFNQTVVDGTLQPWNGGLYLFDAASCTFAQRWHSNTMLAFEHPYWRVRDQATLFVTRLQFGLLDHPIIESNLVRIVDPFWGYKESDRAALESHQLHVDASFRLTGVKASAFLHLINGGVGRRGWSIWDEIEGLLANRNEVPHLA
jgi:hypothetical protein